MAALGLLNHLHSLWPFSVLRVDDLKASEKLVKKLPIPEHTKQFVFAIQDSQTGASLYILCTQNLSERSARDAECLIKELRPDAVFVQTGPMLTETSWQEFELLHQGDSPVPTSALGVLKRCFTNKISKEEYDCIAGNLVLREIFGVGSFEHLYFAKRAAKEVGSSFFTLESVKMGMEVTRAGSDVQPGSNSFGALGIQPGGLGIKGFGSDLTSQSKRFITAGRKIHTELLKPLASYIDLSLADEGLAGDKIELRTDYEAPPFAELVYPLLLDLHDNFTDVPSIGRALACAQKMLHDVDRGGSVDGQILSQIYTFQVAIEGLRVAMNNSGRFPMNRTVNNSGPEIAHFNDLSPEEKSQCLIAQSLRSHTKNFKTSVAVMDATELAGIRKYWNFSVPPEVEEAVKELVMSNEEVDDAGFSKDGERKGVLSNNPVVALGAGATAVLSASSLSKAVPASTVIKAVTLNIPASLKLFLAQSHKAIGFAMSKIFGTSTGFAGSGAKASSFWKASASAGKMRTVTHSIIASAEKTSFSAMRTSFYEIMRKRKVQRIGFLPLATFGCSITTCAGLVVYGDGIECVVESLPSAQAIASMGRGIQNLQQTSQDVNQIGRTRIQMAIESLTYRFRKRNTF